MRLALILPAFMILAAPVWAAWPVIFPALRDALCYLESRSENIPEFAVSPDGAAWGECQVKYATAILYGYPKDANPGDLFNPVVNRATALVVLYGMAKDLGPKHTLQQLISKYGGRGPGVTDDSYIRNVTRIYRAYRVGWWKR